MDVYESNSPMNYLFITLTCLIQSFITSALYLSVLKFESNLLIGLSKYCLGSQQKKKYASVIHITGSFFKTYGTYTIRENDTILYFMG